MKLSLNWLHDYVQPAADQDLLAHKLTMAGLEVETVEKVGKDTVFELEVTPNRADCLSMIGLAREVSAIFDKPLQEPKIVTTKLPARKVPISIEDKNDCAVYLGTLVGDVTVGQASAHIKDRLNSLGIRPISNLVDITNFCMMECGQPLHVFDFDKLNGGCIEVRRARKGEKIVTLDGIERELDPSVLVIADADKPVAIAGIMGGKDTEVGPQTKNVLLESAYFDPILIRRGSRKLGLGSDSSYRFERGVDPAGVAKASERALRLIIDLANGKPAAYGKAGTTTVKKGKPVTVSVDQVSAYIGMPVAAAKVKKIFKKLNFGVEQTARGIRVTPPSSRRDIKAEVDLIEEITRVIGYDQTPEAMPTITENSVPHNATRRIRDQIRDVMLAQGFDEMVSFTLINREDLNRAGLDSRDVAVVTNPLSLDQEVLQPSTLPSLLNIVRTNVNRGQRDLRLFELAKVYHIDGQEHEVLSIVLTGRLRQDWRELKKGNVDIYDLKGAVAQALERTGLNGLRYGSGDADAFQPNRCLSFALHGQALGFGGVLRTGILQNFGIKNTEVLFAQVRIPFQDIHGLGPRKFQLLSNFPAVTRDVSLAIDQGVMYQDILDMLYREGGTLLKRVTFTEEYLGDKIPAGKRGLIFSLLYQSPERTLTEDEVNTVHQQLLSKITDFFPAIIR